MSDDAHGPMIRWEALTPEARAKLEEVLTDNASYVAASSPVESGVWREVDVRRALLHQHPHAVCLSEVSGKVQGWNSAFESLCKEESWKGLEREGDLTGRLHAEIEWAMKEGLKLAAEGVPFERLCKLDGEGRAERWIEVQVTPVPEQRGEQAFAALFALIDLTPEIMQGKTLDRVVRRVELAEDILGELPVAVALVDERWHVKRWLTTAPRSMGISSEIGGDVRTSFITEDSRTQEYFKQLERAWSLDDGSAVKVWESSCVWQDGTTVPVRVRVKATQIEEEGRDAVTPARRRGWLVIIEDISRQRELEEELRQAQKLEALGMLTGGMTHDLNNLLTVILGHLELAESDIPSGHGVRVDLDGIRAAVERASALTVRLLAFARAQMTELQVLDVLDVVTHVRPLLLRTLSEDMRLLLRLDPRTHLIRADPVQLEQLLINLVVNARDALKDARGEIVITTERRRIRMQRKAVGSERIPPGEYVILSVIDNGEGISPSQLSQIFEPFFTTKPEGHGTGLGLSTCMRIVKQNRGYMRCESKLRVGSIFEIWMPLAESGRVMDMSIVSSNEIMDATRGTTVLLVEDDRPLRDTLKRSLEAHGYKVYEARHGKAALTILERMSTLPDLIVTDVAMPDMGGVALFEEVQARGYEVPVLFMSGYSDEVSAVSQLAQRQHFVPKPFTPKRLLLHVQNCLQMQPRGS